MEGLERYTKDSGLHSVSTGATGVESQSPGLSYILIANSVMSRDVWRANGIDSEGSVCRGDQRTCWMDNDETLGG